MPLVRSSMDGRVSSPEERIRGAGFSAVHSLKSDAHRQEPLYQMPFHSPRSYNRAHHLSPGYTPTNQPSRNQSTETQSTTQKRKRKRDTHTERERGGEGKQKQSPRLEVTPHSLLIPNPPFQIPLKANMHLQHLPDMPHPQRLPLVHRQRLRRPHRVLDLPPVEVVPR